MRWENAVGAEEEGGRGVMMREMQKETKEKAKMKSREVIAKRSRAERRKEEGKVGVGV